MVPVHEMSTDHRSLSRAALTDEMEVYCYVQEKIPLVLGWSEGHFLLEPTMGFLALAKTQNIIHYKRGGVGSWFFSHFLGLVYVGLVYTTDSIILLTHMW